MRICHAFVVLIAVFLLEPGDLLFDVFKVVALVVLGGLAAEAAVPVSLLLGQGLVVKRVSVRHVVK